jgi:hypothetical protein
VAHLEPNRKKVGKIKSLSGISNWFEWCWPIDSHNNGYIEARALPNFGKWHSFSPAQIANLSITDFEKPESLIDTYTVSKNTWTSQYTDKEGMYTVC